MNSIAPNPAALAKAILPTTTAARPSVAVDLALTRWAFGIAVGSLLLAGAFSLLLVVGRMPMFSTWVTDPLFFRRCLVLHVDLALIVWFFAFAVGLYSLLPGNRSSNVQMWAGLAVATAGCAAMIAGVMAPGSVPVLANYVPVIDNPVYIAGIAMFFGGLLLCFVSDRLFIRMPSIGPGIHEDAAVGLKATAIAYLLAMTTFLVSVAATPRGLEAKYYYELIFWGGGHVLQVANVAAMMTVWLYLLATILKRQALKVGTARLIFGLLIAPHFIGPLLTLDGTLGSSYRHGFTRLMQFGIAPMVLIALAMSIREIRRLGISKEVLWSPAFIGFAASSSLTITGFLLGSVIRNSNTMIPAHYHASIGAVTVAFMTITYLLLPALGYSHSSRRVARLERWQLTLFGFGQVIFAIGFALGGMHGLGRKAYGSEQHIRSAWEWIGLVIMGAGGLVAVVGGVLFLALVVWALRSKFSLNFRKPELPMIARSHS
jgi:hypothetical protein